MGFNVAGLKSEDWYYTLFKEDYLVEWANKLGNIGIYCKVIDEYKKKNKIHDNKGSLNETTSFEKFFSGQAKEIMKEIDDFLGSIDKVTKNRIIKKVVKGMSNRKFAIEYLNKIQKMFIDDEQKNKRKRMFSEFQYQEDNQEVDFKGYYIKTNFIRQIIENNQKHIPYLEMNDNDFLYFSFEHKIYYGMSDREKKTLQDNNEFLFNSKGRDESLIGKVSELGSEDVKKFILKRFNFMKKRCEDNEWVLPKYERYEEVFFENYNDGFKCHYCGTPMRFQPKEEKKGAKNYEDLFTFEHRKPLAKGGVHSKENLVLTCMCCNTIKADMEEDLFLKILKSIDGETKYKLYEYSYFKNEIITNKIKKYEKLVNKTNKENRKLKVENKLLVNKI